MKHRRYPDVAPDRWKRAAWLAAWAILAGIALAAGATLGQVLWFVLNR